MLCFNRTACQCTMHARPWSCRKTPNFIERDLWPPLRLKMQNVTVNEPNNVLLLYCSSILFYTLYNITKLLPKENGGVFFATQCRICGTFQKWELQDSENGENGNMREKGNVAKGFKVCCLPQKWTFKFAETYAWGIVDMDFTAHFIVFLAVKGLKSAKIWRS